MSTPTAPILGDTADRERTRATLATANYMDALIMQQQLTAQVHASPVLDFNEVREECQKRQANGATPQELMAFIRALLDSEEPHCGSDSP